MNTIGILGGGFGLYGYLPAACRLPGTQVLLPARYAPTVRARTEIAPLAARVCWVPDEHTLWERADLLLVARRPADQEQLLRQRPLTTRVRTLLLEKPLAPDPARARMLLHDLARTPLRLKSGFTLARCRWADVLDHPAGPVSLRWHFRAHHFTHDRPVWKRDPAQGGGALRFFGLHLLAALTRAGGAVTVRDSRIAAQVGTDAVRWTATLATDDGQPITIDVHTDADEPRFELHVNQRLQVAAISPFEVPDGAGADRSEGNDVRVPLLTALLADAHDHREWLVRTTDLWASVEALTTVA